MAVRMEIFNYTCINQDRAHAHSLYEYNKLMTVHKTHLKHVLNPILRTIQFWTGRPLIIISQFNEYNHFLGYGILR